MYQSLSVNPSAAPTVLIEYLNFTLLIIYRTYGAKKNKRDLHLYRF